MTWNGVSWTLVPLPAAAAIRATLFSTAVSCLSATWCIAVGSTGPCVDVDTVPWALPWNGSAWSVMALPNTGDGELNRVSCSTPCFAPRSVIPTTERTRSLSKNFNGNQWAVAPTAIAPPDPNSQLNSVSVHRARVLRRRWLSADQLSNFYSATTLMEIWNGSAWSYDAEPELGHHGEQSQPLGVGQLLLRDRCAAVGSVGTEQRREQLSRTGLEYWNGTAWHLSPVPHYPFSTPSKQASRSQLRLGLGLHRGRLRRERNARASRTT